MMNNLRMIISGLECMTPAYQDALSDDGLDTTDFVKAVDQIVLWLDRNGHWKSEAKKVMSGKNYSILDINS